MAVTARRAASRQRSRSCPEAVRQQGGATRCVRLPPSRRRRALLRRRRPAAALQGQWRRRCCPHTEWRYCAARSADAAATSLFAGATAALLLRAGSSHRLTPAAASASAAAAVGHGYVVVQKFHVWGCSIMMRRARGAWRWRAVERRTSTRRRAVLAAMAAISRRGGAVRGLCRLPRTPRSSPRHHQLGCLVGRVQLLCRAHAAPRRAGASRHRRRVCVRGLSSRRCCALACIACPPHCTASPALARQAAACRFSLTSDTRSERQQGGWRSGTPDLAGP